MHMKKFVATTAREAMRKMKADLGPEAYVISNRKTANGVEILAMAGSAVDDLTQVPAKAVASGSSANVAMRSTRAPAATLSSPFKTLRDIAVHLPASAPGPVAPALQMARPAVPPAAPEFAPEAQLRPVAPVLGAGLNEQRLLDEFRSMKDLLESQVAGLVWRETAQRRPLAVKLWRELTEAGYSPAVARAVVTKLPDDYAEAQARKSMQDVIAHNIRCAAPAQDLIAKGGIYALVGPTGVGKTTTTAKLAARCVVKFGAGSLGLVTTDGYRIGAFDQLAIYGKILGVPVHSAQSGAELEAILASMRGKRLILIDTVGMGQRDARLPEQISLLNHPSVQRLLLLNAAAQAETLDDVVLAYGGASHAASGAQGRLRPIAGTILTKLDEAVKLAPALDTCARHSLEIQYVTSGQRVPEDIHPASAAALAHRSLRVPVNPAFALRDDEMPIASIPAATRIREGV
jgi:flagellar biosynthesis protein FlhF